MRFNDHSALVGKHATLSASKYHWVNYDNDKMAAVFRASQAAKLGTELHELAANLIRLGVKLPRSPKTLNLYVNDGIGFKMSVEQPLVYSANAFGTADAVAFRGNTLRIHDLKTGTIPASMVQLEVYEALFCLEYNLKPTDIKAELRIYQNDEVLIHNPEIDDIAHIMSQIIVFDKIIEDIKAEG